MRFDILTLFPEAITPYLTTSIIGRAQESQLLHAHTWNIRDFATDKHRTVDDTPYGGGAGMVLKIEPVDRTLAAVKDSLKAQSPKLKAKTVVLSARGKQFTQHIAEEYSKLDQLILICGRYEGIDQRVVDYLADEEISVGPYVLAGGEIAALTVLEATARLVPGVLGNPESLTEESFNASNSSRLKAQSYIEYPQYTKPATYRGWEVPAVLRSGNHQAIEQWRREHQLRAAN